jgi:predicted ATP-binding protein involved in virulence
MRLIGEQPRELKIDSTKNVLILLGDNGFGKTTILDAMATAMAPYSAQFPGITDYQLSDLDVHINRHGRRASYLIVDANLSDGDTIMKSVRYRKGTQNTPKANYEQLKQVAITKKNAILAGKANVELPIFAYYGTGRGQFQVPERRRGFQLTFERWDCYKSAINPETDFKRFFGWFDLMEDDERRAKEKLRNFDYKSPVLNAVRCALSKIVPYYKNPRIETHPLRFIMDRTELDGSSHELRIEQLSEGYKIIIAMVADLAARMAEANPDMDNPLASTGIVLIDEVDLHLHPKWQREILIHLTKVFPKIQFIVSTHSPIIVVGAAEVAQIINLNHINETNDLTQENVQVSNIGQVLLSDLFGLDYLQLHTWDEKIKERDNLLAKSELTEQEITRLEQLDEEMKVLTFLPNSNTIRSAQLLEKLAKQLNIEL